VFADECPGETKEENEVILCLVAHKVNFVAVEQFLMSVVAGAYFRPMNQA